MLHLCAQFLYTRIDGFLCEACYSLIPTSECGMFWQVFCTYVWVVFCIFSPQNIGAWLLKFELRFFDALTFKDITLRKNSEIFTLKVARTRGKLLQTRTFQTEKFEIVEFPHKAFSYVTCAHTIWPLQICRHRQQLISVHKVQALSSPPCPAVTYNSCFYNGASLLSVLLWMSDRHHLGSIIK